jgi:superfamily II DNA/RNA helicase
VLARDLTGSGKTLAFSLPMIERFRQAGLFTQRHRAVSMLVLAPTRELAIQVSDFYQVSNVIKSLTHFNDEFRTLTVYGGVSIDD